MDVELKTNNMAYTPFKMKGSPMKRNFGISPMKADINDRKDSKKKKTVGEWFKSTKLGKDLNKAGKQIKRDADKIKKGFESPNLNPHTGEKESRVSRSVGNKKRDLNRVKRNLENKKFLFDRKLRNDLTDLGNKLFKKKKK